jgi:hypothetical protein
MTNRKTRRMFMQKNKPYKYREIEPGEDVLFLLVIKPLHWNGVPDDTKCSHCIPVGAITWVYAHNVALDKDGNRYLYPGDSVHCENNRYVSNFDASCFELLITSKQKIRR